MFFFPLQRCIITLRLEMKSLRFFFLKVWFQNRRAKWRKSERFSQHPSGPEGQGTSSSNNNNTTAISDADNGLETESMEHAELPADHEVSIANSEDAKEEKEVCVETEDDLQQQDRIRPKDNHQPGQADEVEEQASGVEGDPDGDADLPKTTPKCDFAARQVVTSDEDREKEEERREKGGGGEETGAGEDEVDAYVVAERGERSHHQFHSHGHLSHSLSSPPPQHPSHQEEPSDDKPTPTPASHHHHHQNTSHTPRPHLSHSLSAHAPPSLLMERLGGGDGGKGLLNLMPPTMLLPPDFSLLAKVNRAALPFSHSLLAASLQRPPFLPAFDR